MGAVASAVGNIVQGAVSVVTKVVKSVGAITVKAVSAVAKSVEKVGQTVGKIAENIARDPLPTLITYAAQAVGIPAPLTAAAIAAARGSSIQDIAVSAAAVYAGGKVAQNVKVPGLESLSPATQQIIQNTVSGAAGSAAISAISGQSLDNILKSAAAGGISSAVQANLSQMTNAAGQPLFKPGELTTQMINNASAQAVLAVINGKSIQTAIQNAAATTLASYGLTKVASNVKSAYDNLVNKTNELNALLTNKNQSATAIESIASQYSNAVSEMQQVYKNYETNTAEIQNLTNIFNENKAAYDNAVQAIENIKNNPGEFDANYYLQKYPDVANSWYASDPFLHYEEWGQYEEGRYPNANYEIAQNYANQAGTFADRANAAAAQIETLVNQTNEIIANYQTLENNAAAIKNAYDIELTKLEQLATQIDQTANQVQTLTNNLGTAAQQLESAGQAAVSDSINQAIDIATGDVRDRLLADQVASQESQFSQETVNLANQYVNLDPASQEAYQNLVDSGIPPAQAMQQVQSVIQEFNQQQQQQAINSGATEWVDNMGVTNALITGVGVNLSTAEPTPPPPPEPVTFVDVLKNIGGLLGLGTSDPNAVRYALLGTGATGGQFQFGIIGFDTPQKKQQALDQIDLVMDNLTPEERSIIEDVKKSVEAQPITPKPTAGQPGGGGGGGTGAESPESAGPSGGAQTPEFTNVTPAPKPPTLTGPTTVIQPDIVTQVVPSPTGPQNLGPTTPATSTGAASTTQTPLGPSGFPVIQGVTTQQGGTNVVSLGGAGDRDTAILNLISGNGTGQGTGQGGTAGGGFGTGRGEGEGTGVGRGEGSGTGGGIGSGIGIGQGSGIGAGEGVGGGQVLAGPRLITAGGRAVTTANLNMPQQQALLGALLGTGLTSGGTGEPILGEDESKRRLVWNVESLRNALGI